MASAAGDQHLQVAYSFLKEAAADARRVMDIPDEIERMKQGIDLQSKRGRLHLAEVELAKAEKAGADPTDLTNAKSLYYLAKAETHCARLGNGWQKKAVESYRKSIALSPNAVALHNLGVVLWSMKRKKEAIEALRQVQQVGDDEEALDAAKVIARIEADKGPCYVATACYDDANHPDVETFRTLRDERLLPTTTGRALVALYYRIGPRLAHHLEQAGPINRAVRRHVLEPLARRLRGR